MLQTNGRTEFVLGSKFVSFVTTLNTAQTLFRKFSTRLMPHWQCWNLKRWILVDIAHNIIISLLVLILLSHLGAEDFDIHSKKSNNNEDWMTNPRKSYNFVSYINENEKAYFLLLSLFYKKPMIRAQAISVQIWWSKTITFDENPSMRKNNSFNIQISSNISRLTRSFAPMWLESFSQYKLIQRSNEWTKKWTKENF